MPKTAVVLFLAALVSFQRSSSQAPASTPESHKQELFRRIFGERVIAFDPDAVAKVKQLPPGERLKLDTNGDGKIDTIYFIDNDPKHQAAFRPILVKVIDQDGDMDRDGDGDLDSDLYVADWHGDGTVDGVVEYKDTDGDNGVDEMAIYAYSANSRQLGTDAIQVWWSRDMAGTHRLWDTINYRYQQPEVQFRTAFGGDEIFSSYIFDSKKGVWAPSWENPFAFYDEDGDHLAEVAIRFSGSGDRVESMRYSFDADNDTAGDNVHDYDFSLSAVAAENRIITIPPSLMETAPHLRGGPTGPVLSWKNARRFGESAGWGKVQLTWVENDNNVDSRPGGDPHERWEGVIASGTDNFPQVGGPPVGPNNSRYEADLDNSGKLKLYYLAEDRRIHLAGAESGWLKVDYDYDGKVDMEFRYRDTDGDGFIDTWEVDVDGDGRADRTAHVAHPHTQPVPANYNAFTAFYNRTLHDALAANQRLIDQMKTLLRKREADFHVDAVESYFTDKLPAYREESGVGRKIQNSLVGTRYYQDLIRERYFYRVTKALEDRPELVKQLEAVYDSGDYAQTAKLLAAASPATTANSIGAAAFSRRVPVHIINQEPTARVKEPIVLDVAAVRKSAPDFNVRNFAVMSGTRWIAEREIPSQADDLDGDGAPDQIVFMAGLQAKEESPYWLYYSPSGDRSNVYAAETAASSSTGDTAELRWESRKIAYTFNAGRLEFFGKQPDAPFPQDAGVKVLQAGSTSGLGGLTLWENDKPFPVYGALPFQTRVISHGPVRAIVEVTLNGFQTAHNRYDIRQRFAIYAGLPYSENTISIRPANPAATVRFSIGSPKLPNDRAFFSALEGYSGSWGRENNIVQEIGQAAIFPKGMAASRAGENQRDVLLTTKPGETLTYFVVGDWRRGRIFPVAPIASDWENETRLLAARLHSPLKCSVGRVSTRFQPASGFSPTLGP